MDNANEDIIIPKKSNKIPHPGIETEVSTDKKKSKLKLVLICSGVIIICLTGIFIIISNNNSNTEWIGDDSSETDDIGEIVEVETVYTTPEGVEDAEAAYSEWLAEQKQSADTPEAVFDADMQIITNEISQENYDKAIELLDAISRDSLDDTQLFRLYNVYTRVYEGNGDTEKYNEYVELRTEKLNFLNVEE